MSDSLLGGDITNDALRACIATERHTHGVRPDGHKICLTCIADELLESRRVLALIAADTTAADLRQEIEFLKAEAVQ